MSHANLPALTFEELGVLEVVLTYWQDHQGRQTPPLPAVDRNALHHLVLAVREAQGRSERRKVRENQARSPARDLQKMFVEEARTSMGQPNVDDVTKYLGKLVRITFNHQTCSPLIGILRAVDPAQEWILIDGEEDRIAVNAIQSIEDARPDVRL